MKRIWLVLLKLLAIYHVLTSLMRQLGINYNNLHTLVLIENYIALNP